jgi:hypothetical protein
MPQNINLYNGNHGSALVAPQLCVRAFNPHNDATKIIDASRLVSDDREIVFEIPAVKSEQLYQYLCHKCLRKHVVLWRSLSSYAAIA